MPALFRSQAPLSPAPEKACPPCSALWQKPRACGDRKSHRRAPSPMRKKPRTGDRTFPNGKPLKGPPCAAHHAPERAARTSSSRSRNMHPGTKLPDESPAKMEEEEEEESFRPAEPSLPGTTGVFSRMAVGVPSFMRTPRRYGTRRPFRHQRPSRPCAAKGGPKHADVCSGGQSCNMLGKALLDALYSPGYNGIIVCVLCTSRVSFKQGFSPWLFISSTTRSSGTNSACSAKKAPPPVNSACWPSKWPVFLPMKPPKTFLRKKRWSRAGQARWKWTTSQAK